ncbi:MAG: sugar ABC transporter ATP-binding protein [Mucilaginibacter sp.]
MLVAENIGKRFSGVVALENVSMELLAGRVTAILGENGAGKSTLMKILSGVYDEYEGRIIFKGETVKFKNPIDAQDAGIAIIHQELNLVPYLSITENLFLGREITNAFGMLNRKAMRAKTQELLNKLRLNVAPDTLIADLRVGQQQVVEIAKALLCDAEMIIMDEPTSAITESEVDVLFEIIAELKSENKAIVYISHKLSELFKIADDYVVMRDGRKIENGSMAGMTQDQLIHKMVGREINIVRKSNEQSAKKLLLSVKDLSLAKPGDRNKKTLENISFDLYSGEVLGIFGLMGAGRTELMETLLGIHPGLMAGKISIENNELNIRSATDAINSGIVLVPEDRKKDGLVLNMDIKTNISLSNLDETKSAGMLDKAKEQKLSEKYINALKIKCSSAGQTVKNLSGGNQQKVVLAKCLATKPKVLMLDEPTRGIDINAKNEIYKLIIELAAEGMGIIMVSSELPEILAISDRVLVMADGTIKAEMNINDATEDKILKAAIPGAI